MICTLQIAVRAFSNATYTVVASQPTAQFTTLVNGVPQRGTVAHHGWRYFAFQSSGTSDGFAVNLHAERGDADVYVTRRTRPDAHRIWWRGASDNSDALGVGGGGRKRRPRVHWRQCLHDRRVWGVRRRHLHD